MKIFAYDMFNTANYLKNANQKHIEISPHMNQNGYHEKDKK